MHFLETVVEGVFVVELERIEDSRGFFARAWSRDEFEARGLNPECAQANVGFSIRSGTIRGMHYQAAPWQEAKVVRCTMGAIYDVAVDLRPESATHKRWVGVELTAEDRRMLYIPEGCGHGYQTLADNTEIYYQTSQFYSRESARGVRYNDPALAIGWPIPASVVSEADRNWPDYHL